MAAVGVALSGGSSPNKHNVEIHAYETSWSTETNTSTVTLIARLLHTQGSPGSFGSVGSWTLGRVGMPVAASGGASYDFRGKPIPSWIDQGSTSITVPHNADGTGSVTVQAGFTSSHLGNGMATLTLPLTTIPRASKATYAGGATFEAGSPVTIDTNRASGSFTHKIEWLFGDLRETIGTSIGASVSWTPPLSMLSQIPDSTSGNGGVLVTTYSGSTVVGVTDTPFTLRAPASVVPVVSALTKSDTSSSVNTIVGTYVQGLSSLQVTVPASGVYGSTITSQTFQAGGNSAASGGSIPLLSSGTLNVIATAIDSRGRSGTRTETINVLPYASPTFAKVLVQRSSAAGAIDNNGTSLRVDLEAAVSSLINSTQRNTMQIKVFTRPRGTTSWVARNTINHSTISYNSNFVVSGGANYPIDDSFDVRVDIVDKFNTSSAQTVVATAAVFQHWSKTGVGIGKFHEQGALDVSGNIYQNGNLVVDVTRTSTETVRGIIELATQAEVNSGTDTTRAVTPHKLRRVTHLPFAMASGLVSHATVPAQGGVSATVTLPAGRFSVAPIVQLTSQEAQTVTLATTAKSATSVTIRVSNWLPSVASGAGVIAWTAIQMTGTAANG